MAQQAQWGIAVHGGSRNLAPGEYTAAETGKMHAVLEQALGAAHQILADGGASLDAVQAAVVVLEDAPDFNAGKGAVFSHEGCIELDASIMDGHTLKAGAVAGLRRIRNPIALARLIMDRSPYVLLAGAGAEDFALTQGVELVDPAYFHTDSAWRRLQKALAAEKATPPPAPHPNPLPAGGEREKWHDRFGTVGAVALDRHGNLAAGTSTGGMTNKHPGRVSDSAVIGAGTYADNASCAVSATGHGEYFIRYAVAHDICARVRYSGAAVQHAADSVVLERLGAAGGEGGVIAMDAGGRAAFSFNTDAMFHGYRSADGSGFVKHSR